MEAGPFLLVHHVDLDGVGLMSHLVPEAVLSFVGDAQRQVDHFEFLVVQRLWSKSDENLFVKDPTSFTWGSNRNDKPVKDNSRSLKPKDIRVLGLNINRS